MSERYRRIRKRERELYGYAPKFDSGKIIAYDFESSFTKKFISKKETLIDFKINPRLDNLERIKQQLELGHLEIMDEKLKARILSESDKAEFIKPMIIIQVDCYDKMGNFKETREILAYEKFKEGRDVWLDLEADDVDDSFYDQLIEIDDRVSQLDEYDFNYAIAKASIYYSFFYGA